MIGCFPKFQQSFIRAARAPLLPDCARENQQSFVLSWAINPFGGRLVEQLGVGPKPIAQLELTADRLADAIRLATSNLEMQKRAEQLGNKIRAENGVARAVEIINAVIPM